MLDRFLILVRTSLLLAFGLWSLLLLLLATITILTIVPWTFVATLVTRTVFVSTVPAFDHPRSLILVRHVLILPSFAFRVSNLPPVGYRMGYRGAGYSMNQYAWQTM